MFIEDHMSLKYQRVLQGLDTIHPFAKASLHLPASLPLPPSLSLTHTHTHPPKHLWFAIGPYSLNILEKPKQTFWPTQ